MIYSCQTSADPIRIGLIVPSSNVTMEKELPCLFRTRETVLPERFSFHASRVRMRRVDPQELLAMNAQAGRSLFGGMLTQRRCAPAPI